MNKIIIKELLENKEVNKEYIISGWVRTKRSSKNIAFIMLNDGSCLKDLQIILDDSNLIDKYIDSITTGTSISVSGKLIKSEGKGQTVELIAQKLDILGESDPETYPIQPKRHTLDFLRKNAHLRFRTRTYSSVFRIRHGLSFAIHKFFHTNNFYYIHTPIITSADAEGAGEMFKVTTLDLMKLPIDKHGDIDYSKDFFEKQVNLTVSGQLEAELAALGLSKVYTFGPTFRAENSNTSRHLAEFWMIEPEVAFADLDDNMDLAEDFLKYCIQYVLDTCPEDLAFLDKRITDEEKNLPKEQKSEMGLMERLKFVLENDFERLTYTEAINILRNSKPNKKKKFQYLIEGFGADLQSEHERYLVEKKFKKPVILTDYPKGIKAFYMRMNEDGETVRAMDILFPGIGEIIGGSQREERLDKLQARMDEMDVCQEELWWYLETRKFGTCPHSGFGLGFERLIMFVTGMKNVRDVIAFPRTPQNATF